MWHTGPMTTDGLTAQKEFANFAANIGWPQRADGSLKDIPEFTSDETRVFAERYVRDLVRDFVNLRKIRAA